MTISDLFKIGKANKFCYFWFNNSNSIKNSINLIIGQEIGNQKDEVKGGGDNDLYNYSSNEDELFKSVKKNIKAKESDKFFFYWYFFFHFICILFLSYYFIIYIIVVV